jgi:hypothetical protein
MRPLFATCSGYRVSRRKCLPRVIAGAIPIARATTVNRTLVAAANQLLEQLVLAGEDL